LALGELSAQAAQFDAATLVQDITILEELRRTLRQSQAGRALLDATLVRLTLADQFASIGDLLSRLDGGSGAPRPPAPARPAASRPVPPAQKKNLSDAANGGSALRTDSAAVANEMVRSADPAFVISRQEQVADAVSRIESNVVVSQPQLEPVEVAAVSQSTSTYADDDDDDLPTVGKVWSAGSESLSSLMAKHRAATSSATSTAVAEPVIETPVVAPQGNLDAVDPQNLPAIWQSMLGLLANHGTMLHSVISQGQLISIDDEHVVLRFGPQNETFIKQWEKNGKRDIIREAASKALNKNVGVKFEIDKTAAAQPAKEAPKPTATPIKRPAPVPEAPVERSAPETPTIKVTQELVESLAAQTPLIKSVMQRLGGQIVKVE
jgi:hypothetical protein